MKTIVTKLVILAVVAVGLVGVGNAVLSTFEPTVSQTVGVEQALDTDAAHQNARAYQRMQGWLYGAPVAVTVVFALLLFRKEIGGVLGSKKDESTEETKKEPEGEKA